jgi:hypothetical protein
VQYSSGYVPYLLQAQHSRAVCDALGTDVMGSGKETYNINLEILMLISMLMKVISDVAPTITDAAWQQRLNIAMDTGPNGDRSGWPGWVVLQVPPESLGLYGASLTDSVATLQQKIAAYVAP